MTSSEIMALASSGIFDGRELDGQLIETHISWVILSEDFAFKIKKPLRYAFLDFSSLGKRKFYCERELFLNRRFSNIYLDVLPIVRMGEVFAIGGSGKNPIEYCVRMKRLNNTRKLDNMLRESTVTVEQICIIAHSVNQFHQTAEVINTPFRIETLRSNFNNITTVSDWVGEVLGDYFGELVKSSVKASDKFLERNIALMNDRVRLGFRRDLHGDLHSGNIFLYDDPVIFDCIEFNDEMRRIDVIDELAFFCMDLHAHGRDDLRHAFVLCYNRLWPCIRNAQDRALFGYFMAYRANVRAKVYALKAKQTADAEEKQQNVGLCAEYLETVSLFMPDI